MEPEGVNDVELDVSLCVELPGRPDKGNQIWLTFISIGRHEQCSNSQTQKNDNEHQESNDH